ncbi:MAG: hypothetical protein KIH03_00205 [Paludibacteraceae bacterium]|nr:hypothetical protein [Paludibacteraceae bacterium]
MSKKEIINAIVSNLRTPEGRYEIFPINKIIPPQYRRNARFASMIGDYLSVREENGEAKLILCYDTGSVCYWKCPKLKNEIYESILNAIEESRKPKLYVITKDEAYYYEQSSDVVLVTTDKEKALKEFEKYREEIREYAEENDFVFDDGDTSVECYEEGYAAQSHYCVTLYERNLV